MRESIFRGTTAPQFERDVVTASDGRTIYVMSGYTTNSLVYAAGMGLRYGREHDADPLLLVLPDDALLERNSIETVTLRSGDDIEHLVQRYRDTWQYRAPQQVSVEGLRRDLTHLFDWHESFRKIV